MTNPHFREQLRRIQDQFGSFGTERAVLLWSRVNHFSDEWFKKVIDEMIANMRHCPIVADFETFISLERERLHQAEKKQHAKEAEVFYSEDWGTYPGEDKRNICQTIQKILRREMSDQDTQNFIGLLSQAANAASQKGIAQIAKGQGE